MAFAAQQGMIPMEAQTPREQRKAENTPIRRPALLARPEKVNAWGPIQLLQEHLAHFKRLRDFGSLRQVIPTIDNRPVPGGFITYGKPRA